MFNTLYSFEGGSLCLEAGRDGSQKSDGSLRSLVSLEGGREGEVTRTSCRCSKHCAAHMYLLLKRALPDACLVEREGVLSRKGCRGCVPVKLRRFGRGLAPSSNHPPPPPSPIAPLTLTLTPAIGHYTRSLLAPLPSALVSTLSQLNSPPQRLLPARLCRHGRLHPVVDQGSPHPV